MYDFICMSSYSTNKKLLLFFCMTLSIETSYEVNTLSDSFKMANKKVVPLEIKLN